MTIQMIITLAIVIGMIVMIMSDKFAFGAPPLIACVLLVLTGCATMSEAFAGFVDKNVIMIAGFMVVMAALEKTSLIDKVKATMFNMASKGGYRNYILLLIVVMLGASVMSGTGYYVLVLSLVSTIPYNKNLPISKIFMPLGYATLSTHRTCEYGVLRGLGGLSAGEFRRHRHRSAAAGIFRHQACQFYRVFGVGGYRLPLPAGPPHCRSGRAGFRTKVRGRKAVQVERNRCVYCFRGQLRSYDLPG